MNIKFSVSPYALFDTLKALENTKDQHRRIEYSVTKEDDELYIHAIERYFFTPSTTTHTTSCTTTNCINIGDSDD